jgi:hypothetical protein
MSVEEKTELIIAIHDYKYVKKEKRSDYTDVTALDALNEKILLRSIEPEGKGYVSIGDVKDMIAVIKREEYNRGILISKRFTVAAVEEMVQENIQKVSDEYMPPFDTEKLYLAITNCINNQCKTRCGIIRLKKSECQKKQKTIPCKVKALGDNASFHFDQGWVDLLKNDLKLALALNKL